MISVKFESSQFLKEMTNVVNYAEGFVDGAKAGRAKLMDRLGENVSQVIAEYIDSSARANPGRLHHIYEWGRAGDPSERLFEISYRVSGGKVEISSDYRQSQSVSPTSDAPFREKARVMESGQPITVAPVKSDFLTFEVNGEQIFTRNPVTIQNPGGPEVAGSYEATFRSFFESYFKQSYLVSSGLYDNLSRPREFKRGISKAKSGGRSAGYSSGKKWVEGAI
jgi:hypothetical protein